MPGGSASGPESATTGELDRARAREAATREILEVISHSRDDDRPVFDAILRSAQALCGADAAALLLGRAEGPHLTLAALQQDNLSKAEIDAFIAGTNQPPMRMDPTLHVSSQAICSGEIVHIADLAKTQGYLSGEPTFRFMVEDQGLHTTLSVPLFDARDAIGAISMHRREVRLFTDDEVDLIQSFAAQAVIAIENVRQFRELQTRLEREAATREILEVISQSRDDDHAVFDVIVSNAAKLCNAPMAWLVLADAAQRELVVAGYTGLSRRQIEIGDTFELESEPDTITGLGRAIREARTIQDEDLAQSSTYLKGAKDTCQLVDVEGIRTRLSVPLISGGRGIGAILLSRRDVAPFSADQIALAETFAAQAVIAIENVRQFRALQTRLEREAATREILEVISASRDDDRPVFDVVLRNAARLCSASMAGLNIVSEDRSHAEVVAEWGDHVTDLRPVGVMVWPMESDHAPSTCMREGRIVHVHDLADTDLYRSGDPIRLTAVDVEGIRTFLAVPLFSGGRTVSCITIYRREVRPFTPDEIALVETFAAQAVIAIENVRQFRELQTRLAREAATREILEVISQSRDDDRPVFEVIAQSAARLCGAANCTFWRVENGLIEYCASYGFDRADFEDELRTPMSESLPLVDNTLIGQAVKTRSVARIEDGTAESYLNHEWVRAHGLRHLIGVPIFVGDDVWGSINLMWPADQAPRDEDIQLVEGFAAQASIAIENVRQFRELQTRLAREAATREILEVISQSRDDDQPVFEVVLRKSADLCGASLASLIIISEDRSHAVMVADWGDHVSDQLPVGTTVWPMDADFAPSICMREGRVVHLHDLADTDLYRSGDPMRTAAVDDEGIRTFLAVPLFSGGQTVGCIAVYRREVRPFSADEIALVETFAAQAVIAIENVRQFRELQTRLEREAATREILQVISQSRDDEQPVFDAILRNAARLCEATTGGLIIGRSSETHWRTVAMFGADALPGTLPDFGLVPMDPAQSITARAIVSGETVHTRDILETQEYKAGAYAARIVGDEIGARVLLNVPLMQKNGALGAIELQRLVPVPFTQPQIELVQSFAAQAVIAIENVRQFRELQAKLAREAATGEILGVISRSRDDDQPVFETIVQNAQVLCDAPMCGLVLARPGDSVQTLAAHRNLSDRTVDLFHSGKMLLDASLSYAAKAILECSVINHADMKESELYRKRSPVVRAMVDNVGIRSVLFVPLVSGHEGIGVLALFRYQVAPFDDLHVELVQSFAAQAVIAIENVRQFRELQTRLAREAATREILEVISRNPDDDRPVFDAILGNAIRLCGADTSVLFLGRQDDPRLTLAAWRDRTASSSVMEDEMIARTNATPMRMDPTVHVSAKAIIEEHNFHIIDMTQHPAYLSGEPSFEIMVDTLGVRTALFVPLIGAHGALGTVNVHRREVKPFTPDEIALVETFAAQAVIAIENVRQFKALEALNAELGDRVMDQVGEIERMGRLKRFLPTAVADAVVTSGSEKLLSSHRALLGVLFCDIRGFTAFCETAEPEETIEVLQTYHEEMGKLINAHGAGVDHRMGDGIMVLFNDPLPCDDPAGEAVRLAIAMRARMAELGQQWKRLGHRLGFGVGISLGYATVGMVGFEGRFDYTASGTAINLASRLCDEALDGEILLSPRASIAVEDRFPVESRGEITLKGIREPVEVFRLTCSAAA